MKKLLIVDDDEALRGLYQRRLSGSYQVFTTGDPEQALALALEHKPDAVILDLKMPKVDGFALSQNFRSLSYTSNLPIFVITGQSTDFRKEFRDLGAAGYFQKPIDFAQLKQKLATTLDSQPSHAEHRSGALSMKVSVKLEGEDERGEKFSELTQTEAVSADGFECTSRRKLKQGSSLNVSLVSPKEDYAGMVKIEERRSAGLDDRQRYRVRFSGPARWILQQA